MQPGTWQASVHEEVRVNVGNANASTGRLGTRGDVYFVDELMYIGSVGWLFLDPRLKDSVHRQQPPGKLTSYGGNPACATLGPLDIE